MFTFKNTSKTLSYSPHFREFLRGLKVSIPLLLGIIPFALVLGAQATQKGFSVLEVPLLTGLNFAGGSEFAILEVWTNPPNIIMLMFITFLINSRHLLMGASFVPYLRHLPNKTAFSALFFMCDESWALGLADAQKKQKSLGVQQAFSLMFYAGLCFALYVMWIGFTTLGAWIGPMFGDISRFGFDMAFPAVFLVLLRGMWKGIRAARPWLVSLIAAALAYHFLPSSWYIPVGAISGIISAFFLIGDDE
ncbi:MULTISPECIES: AzlC family ABC transporter permease [Acinetobacter]|uniref:AzlC family ABC transporter permease n=1 Tax=Acinetobacter TaxID=469 RepID=UPI00101EF1CE|nr:MULTISPECIES: AzlC family ABC transporter permease [Acinetobacter]MDM1756675.1 AzlC family ABC transporter permease [Acinetobacter sp. 256-1]MDM1759591.1 AzlC family ABC transporter permease [Acinetobacter sp. 251-1]RYL28401.1 branched-chain amino acid ABC transporter permease [Acinetobacter piscicola]